MKAGEVHENDWIYFRVRYLDGVYTDEGKVVWVHEGLVIVDSAFTGLITIPIRNVAEVRRPNPATGLIPRIWEWLFGQ